MFVCHPVNERAHFSATVFTLLAGVYSSCSKKFDVEYNRVTIKEIDIFNVM